MLLEGVRLSDIWKKDELTDKNKNTIWRYLQLLTLLSRRSIITQTELKMMLSKVGTSINVLEKVDDTLEEKEEGKKESGGMFGGLADAFAGDNDGEVNLLGELMKGFGLGKIFENFNMNEFMEQMETGFNQESSEPTESEPTESEPTESEPNFNDTCGDVNVSNSGNIEVEKSTQSNSTGQEQTEQDSTMPNIFKELASDVAETFNIDPTADDDDPKKAMEQFQNIMSGDGQKKLFGLVSKFTAGMQRDMQSGKINQQAMMSQYASMMQQTGINPAQMATEMEKCGKITKAQKNRVVNSNRNQTQRDRLRAVLEKRNAEKQGKSKETQGDSTD